MAKEYLLNNKLLSINDLLIIGSNLCMGYYQNTSQAIKKMVGK